MPVAPSHEHFFASSNHFGPFLRKHLPSGKATSLQMVALTGRLRPISPCHLWGPARTGAPVLHQVPNHGKRNRQAYNASFAPRAVQDVVAMGPRSVPCRIAASGVLVGVALQLGAPKGLGLIPSTHRQERPGICKMDQNGIRCMNSSTWSH